jgi:Tol biopolymer transport system component
MNTDGSGAQTIFASRLTGVRAPQWSPDGSRIAVIESDLDRAQSGDPNANLAQESEISLIAPNGSYLSSAGRTVGITGVIGSVPGCGGGDPGCSRQEIPAIDAQVNYVSWSPDGQRILAELVRRGWESTGFTSDAQTSLLLLNPAQNQPIDAEADVPPAQRTRTLVQGVVAGNTPNQPDWGTNNSVLFVDKGRSTSETDGGIFSAPAQVSAPVNLAVANYDGVTDNQADSFPTWSPDASQFMTVRRVAGGAFQDDDGNDSITVHIPGDVTRTRSIAIVDYPARIDGKPAWSPDGRYLLYTVLTPTGTNSQNSFNIWWLDVQSGATGPLNSDGVSAQPAWRRTAPGANPPPTDRSFRVFLPLAVR